MRETDPPTRLLDRDVRDCFRLVQECRELGADFDAWHRRLSDGLRAIAGARVAIGGQTLNFEPGAKPENLAVVRVGWEDEAAERRWREYAERVPLERKPEFPRLIRFRGRIITTSRDEIWTPENWYRSRTYNEVHRLCGLDDFLISIVRIPGTKLSNSVFLHRSADAGPFTRRDRLVVHLVHEQIGRLIGRALAPANEPRVETLTRRQRETLGLLLDGLSEKEVAQTMGISRPTVHEYVTAVYRHFDASSRGELMAQFIGRDRPSFGDEREVHA